MPLNWIIATQIDFVCEAYEVIILNLFPEDLFAKLLIVLLIAAAYDVGIYWGGFTISLVLIFVNEIAYWIKLAG